MFLIKPSYEILCGRPDVNFIAALARTCYKSEPNGVDTDADKHLVSLLIKRGHESQLEHQSMTVRFVIDRGVSHELVRHRLAAYSQESTRYCNYRGGVTFVIPPWVDVKPGEYNYGLTYANGPWFFHMLACERAYLGLLDLKQTPQQARSVLPNSLATTIVMTANIREWRHVFRLRCAKEAHPQMREVMIPLRDSLIDACPVMFEDLVRP